MQLSWRPGFTQSRKPTRRVNARRSNRETFRDGHGEFEFVVENPPRNQNPTDLLSVSISRHSRTSPTPADADASTRSRVFKDQCKSINNDTFSQLHNSPHDLRQPQREKEADFEYNESSIGSVTAFNSETLAALQPPISASNSIPPNVLYKNLCHRYKPVFDQYNNEFCRIPLTFNLRINPFRCRSALDSEPNFLVHAVMALAGHHIRGSTSSQDHRHAALQCLRRGLEAGDLARPGNSMLDTIIILFSFDETQSASGNWSTHLMGAYSLLTTGDGIIKRVQSPRTAVQIGLLLWWDAILSLLSREDCVFPYDYFEALLSAYGNQDCDFFGLCGCPLSLVKVVMRLARLSAEKQKSSSIQCWHDVKFKNSSIAEAEHSLESWQQHASYPTPVQYGEEEEYMQKDTDMMHCSEAWRNGLLLYLYRVFQWLGERAPLHVLYRARAVVDHVTSCRDEKMVSRQALLPLFFAGCELRSPSSREKIIKFCTHWGNKTRYHVFNSAVPLLREVWARQELDGFENVWWGQVVDQWHRCQPSDPFQMRLCFG